MPLTTLIPGTGSVAQARNWTILDRFGMTASLYMSYATDARFDNFDLYLRNDGIHWKWGILRELNLQLLQLLEQYWPEPDGPGAETLRRHHRTNRQDLTPNLKTS